MPKPSKHKKRISYYGVMGFHHHDDDDCCDGDGGMGQNIKKHLKQNDTALGGMKPWYEYYSLKQMYADWFKNHKPQEYIQALHPMIKQVWKEYIDKLIDLSDIDMRYSQIHRNAFQQAGKTQKFKMGRGFDDLKTESAITQNVQQLTQISTTGATPGYQTPFAFTGNGKTRKPNFLKKMGYKIVNEQFIQKQFKKPQQKFQYYKKLIKKTFKIDISKYKQRLIGGLSDGTKPNQITKYPLKQLLMGIKVQRQHSKDGNIRLQICLDHLQQHPTYYTELKKMQSKLQKKKIQK